METKGTKKLRSFLLSLGCIFLLMFGTSCASRQTRTVWVDRWHSEHAARIQTDTIWMRDTLQTYTRGDTVYRDRVSHRYRYLRIRDSVLRRDSIPYAVEVVREVNRLRPHQQRAIIGYYLLLSLCGVGVFWGVSRWIRRMGLSALR